MYSMKTKIKKDTRKSRPSYRAFLFFICLVLFIVTTIIAFNQRPWSDPFNPPEFPESLLYPIEQNAFKRLPVVTADLMDVFALPDTEIIWVIGKGAMILHSKDGGENWEQQTVDFNSLPALPPTQIESKEKSSLFTWPEVVSEAYAIIQKDEEASVEQQAPVKEQELLQQQPPSKGQEPAQPQVPVEQKTPAKQPDTPEQEIKQEPPAEQKKLELPAKKPELPDFKAVYFVNSQQGWIVGEGGVIVHTKDGGKTWSIQESNTSEQLNSVHFSQNGLYGWVVGEYGVIFHTTNGGNVWQPQSSGVQYDLFHVYFLDDGFTGWAVGNYGVVLYTLDGGESWSIEKRAASKLLNSVDITENGLKGWAVGNEGTVIHFASEGQGGSRLWEVQKSGISESLFSVHFIENGSKGWVVGDNGIILQTTDGGADWKPQASGVKEGLLSVSFLENGLYGWAVGYNGTTVHTTNGGKTWFPQTRSVIIPKGVIEEEEDIMYHRYPAPWYYFSLLVLIVLLVPALKPPEPEVVEEKSVADMLVSDRPLEFGEPDPLKFNEIALGLSRFLRNENTEPPLTIAITGEWGTGKSSLMNLLKTDLSRYGFQPVWFNAWHHQREENLLAAILESIRKQAAPSLWRFEGWLFRARLFVLRGWKKWLPALFFIFSFFALSGYFFHYKDRVAMPTGPYDAVKKIRHFLAARTFYQLSDASLKKLQFETLPDKSLFPDNALEKLKKLSNKKYESEGAFLEAVEKVLNSREETVKFKGILFKHARKDIPLRDHILIEAEKLDITLLSLVTVPILIGLLLLSPFWFLRSLAAFGINPANLLATITGQFKTKNVSAQLGFRQEFAKKFREVTKALNPRTMLIFIDDLDRCLPENVLTVLESINFLVSSGECFIVVSMEMEQVERCIGLTFKEVAEEVIELPHDPQQQQDLNEAGKIRRSHYARQYMEKLINIEVPIPAPTSSQIKQLMKPEKAEPEKPKRSAKIILHDAFKFFRPGLPFVIIFLVIAFGLGLGLWKGQNITKSAKMAKQKIVDESMKSDTAKEPVADYDLTREEKKKTEQKRGIFQPGQSAKLFPMHYFMIFTPLILLLLAGGYIILTKPALVVKDSPAFIQALEIWHPLIIAFRNTPRSVKRFMNRVRYLAMRLRKNEPVSTLLQRILYWFKKDDKKTEPKRTTVKMPDEILVALSAIHHFKPDWIMDDQLFSLSEPEMITSYLKENQDPFTAAFITAVKEHKDRFKTWPPAKEQRTTFLEMTAQSIQVH